MEGVGDCVGLQPSLILSRWFWQHFHRCAVDKKLRQQILQRDRDRCTVGGLLGTPCKGRLHIHHINPRLEAPELVSDPDNLATVCARHHVQWEHLRRQILRHRDPDPPRCHHRHLTLDGRLQCEARLARRRVAA